MQLKTLYFVFSIGALMFIAKPFMGYSLGSVQDVLPSHTIMVKSFSKRKPEDLNDGKKLSTSISQQLTNPPEHISLTLVALLCLLFPLLAGSNIFISNNFLNNCKVSLSSSGHLYLLTGKLTI